MDPTRSVDESAMGEHHLSRLAKDRLDVGVFASDPSALEFVATATDDHHPEQLQLARGVCSTASTSETRCAGASVVYSPRTSGAVASYPIVADPLGNLIELSQRASLTGPLPE